MKTRWTEERLRNIALAWIAAECDVEDPDFLEPDLIAAYMPRAQRIARKFTQMLDAAERSTHA